MAISADHSGEKVTVHLAKCLSWAGQSHIYSHDRSQKAKASGHRPSSGSTPSYSLGRRAAPAPVTSSWGFLTPQEYSSFKAHI